MLRASKGFRKHKSGSEAHAAGTQPRMQHLLGLNLAPGWGAYEWEEMKQGREPGVPIGGLNSKYVGFWLRDLYAHTHTHTSQVIE